MTEYDPADDARKCYELAIEIKRVKSEERARCVRLIRAEADIWTEHGFIEHAGVARYLIDLLEENQ